MNQQSAPVSRAADPLARAETSMTDRTLFAALGLNLFDVATGVEHFVGEVIEPHRSRVKIWVCCMPAQFWKFEIYCIDSDRTTTLSTGSGNMKNFWPFVRQVTAGMMVVDSISQPCSAAA